MSRRDTGPSQVTVLQVLRRDGYSCVRCGRDATGERGRDWSVQHRRPRGMGGSRRNDTNSPQNLIVLCGSATSPGGCHEAVESHRAEAIANGWLLWQTQDPAAEPVLVAHSSRWVWLTEDGRYSSEPPAGGTTSKGGVR